MIQVGKFSQLSCPSPTNRTELNPDPDNLPKLDPKDEFLAYDVSGSSANTNAPGTPGQNVPLANVPWLRKTEYTSKSDGRASINEMYVLTSYAPYSPSNSRIGKVYLPL